MEVVVEEEITGAIIVVRKLIGVNMDKYIIELPNYFDKNEHRLVFNELHLNVTPYEETADAYKETLEFLRVATKEELAKVYGYTSLDSLFGSESVETIVNDFKTAVDNRKRVRELAEDIGLDKMYSIVKELKGESD